MAITTTITALPDPPSRSDPDNFVSRADAFHDALPDLAIEMNAFGGETNATQSAINASEAAALAAKNAAEAARDAAAFTAAAAPYSGAATYDTPATAASSGRPSAAIGSDGHTYRCRQDGTQGDDPASSGSGAWLRLTVGAAGAWTPVTSAASPYQAKSGDRLAVDTTGGAVTLTLPASPVLGDRIEIIDDGQNSATNAITVARNGKTIQGTAEDMTVNTNGLRFALDYFSGAGDWRIANVSY